MQARALHTNANGIDKPKCFFMNSYFLQKLQTREPLAKLNKWTTTYKNVEKAFANTEVIYCLNALYCVYTCVCQYMQ
jgi:carotenoid cleavage dioxygenase-like enzyme